MALLEEMLLTVAGGRFNIRSQSWFDKCKDITVYDICTPKASPDVNAFKDYLRWAEQRASAA